MACKIEKLVRETVDTVDETRSVQDAVRVMAERNLGSIVVTRDGAVNGLFTERDLVRRVVGVAKEPAATPLRDVCSTDLISIPHDSTCQEAIRVMHANSCRRLLVYKHGDLLGLLRLPDVAHELSLQGPGKNLLVNILGGITLIVTLGVIAMLIMEFPNMMAIAERVTR